MNSVKIPESAKDFLIYSKKGGDKDDDAEKFFETQADLLLFAAFLSRKAIRESFAAAEVENSGKDSIDIQTFERDGRYPRFLAASMLHLEGGERVVKKPKDMCEAIYEASHIGFEFLKKKSKGRDIKEVLLDLLIE
jgi:hypothetical protein